MPDNTDLVELIGPDGTVEYRPREFIDTAIAQGYRPASAAETLAREEEASREAYFTTPAKKAEVLARGAVGAATLGGFDALNRALTPDEELEQQRLANEYNPGYRVAGQVGGSILTSVATGGFGTSALAGRGLSGRILAETIEGGVQGIGQAVSNVALSANPITAELVTSELLSNTALGAGIGAGAATIFGVGGKVAAGVKNKLKSSLAEEITTPTDDLLRASALPAEARNKFVSEFEGGLNEIDEAAKTLNTVVDDPITPRDMIYSYRASAQKYDDAMALADLSRAATPAMKQAKAQYERGRRALSEVTGNNPLFERPGMADAGGQELLGQLDATARQKLYQGLEDMRAGAVAMDVANGGDGQMKWAEFTGETTDQLKNRYQHTVDFANNLYDEGALPKKLLNKLEKELDLIGEADLEDVTKTGKQLNKLESLLEEATAGKEQPFVRMVSPGKLTGNFTPEQHAAGWAKDPHKKIKSFIESKSAENPALKTAWEAAQAVNEEFDAIWGTKNGKLTPKSINAFLSLPADKALEAAKVYQKKVDTLASFVGQFDSTGNATTRLSDALERIKGATRIVEEAGGQGVSGREMFAALMGSQEVMNNLPDAEGPVDDILKWWVIARMASGKSVLPGAIKGRVAAKASTLGQRLAQGAAGEATSQASGVLRQAAGAVGIPTIVQNTLNRLLGQGSKIAQITGAGTARLANAVEGLARGASKTSRFVAPTALTLLNAYKFGKDNKEYKNPTEAYMARLNELADIAGNPLEARRRVHDNLVDLRRVNARLGDEAEQAIMDDAAFIYEKMDKDPGGHMFFGKSRWRPTEESIHKLAAYLRGFDPVGVLERVVSGRITPQEAETVRARRPAVFAEIQRQLFERAEEVQQRCTFDQRVRLSILFDVPVDPLASKQTVSFFQEQYAARAAAPENQPQKMDGSKLKSQQQPTEAQKLQGR